MNFLRVAPLAVLAVLALTACPDPAKNKPKAQVTAAPAEPAHPAGAPAPPAIPGTPLRFSEAGSSISWTGAKVTASHAGTFQKFNGAIGLVDGDPAKSVVYVSVVTDSIFTADSADLLEHLKGADFFDVQKFPLATFRSTAISAGGGAARRTPSPACSSYTASRRPSPSPRPSPRPPTPSPCGPSSPSTGRTSASATLESQTT